MEIQLVASPSVTTRTAAEFAGRLGESAAADRLLIDVSEIDEVDLTFLQVVDVYRQELAGAGRSLVLSTHENPHIKSLLSRSGYLEGAEPSDLEFWIGEETE